MTSSRPILYPIRSALFVKTFYLQRTFGFPEDNGSCNYCLCQNTFTDLHCLMSFMLSNKDAVRLVHLAPGD